MRAPGRPPGAAPAAADPIAWHPAMRRTVLALQARTDAIRLLAYWIGLRLDCSLQHPDTARRAEAGADVAVLTPVAKALFTELGHRGADEALQVWGGYGYVHEYGIEQLVRESRIALIYGGTNEIQAIDLVARKLLPDGGRAVAALRARLAPAGPACAALPGGEAYATALARELEAWAQADATLLEAARHGAEAPLQAADDYLMGVGHALMAWAWARIAHHALQTGPDTVAGARTAAQWLDSARFGVEWLLPQALVHWQRVRQRDAALPFLSTA